MTREARSVRGIARMLGADSASTKGAPDRREGGAARTDCATGCTLPGGSSAQNDVARDRQIGR